VNHLGSAAIPRRSSVHSRERSDIHHLTRPLLILELLTLMTAHSDAVADRITPSRRPAGHALMYQKWRLLLFLHWTFPPDAIRAQLPPGLELDTFGGRAYVGLVPFTMREVRPAGVPAVPWLSYFHETNVRTYVHLCGRDPGVWFFSLDAANPVAVALARAWFHLPYHHARMSLERDGAGAIRYTSRRLWPGPLPARSALGCVPEGTPSASLPGTLDHFLLERYLLYTTRSKGLYCGQVHHTPYPAQSAKVIECEETLLAAAGLERPGHLPLVHYSEGVDVEIFPLRKVPIS
jgi:uncharacterized protein YqjF (DUF2071 family)